MAKPLCRKRERIYITSIHNQFKLSRSWSKLPWYILAPQIKLMFIFFKHKNTHKKRMKDQGKVSKTKENLN